MRALCKEHNLAVAADGKCVMCRRPPGAHLGLADEPVESLSSKLVTWSLLLGLLGALGSFLWLATLPEPYAGPRTAMQAADSYEEPARPEVLEVPEETLVPANMEPLDASARAEGPDLPAQPAVAPVAQEALAQTGAKPGESEPTAEALQAATAKVPVKLYMAEWCFICDQTREYLELQGVAVEQIDVERDEASRQAMLKFNPTGNLPALRVDGKAVLGFNPYTLDAHIQHAARKRL